MESLSWTTFLAVYMNLTLASHTSSVWLGVIMAAMRYFFVRPTARGAQSLECKQTIIVVIVTFVLASLMIIPSCLVTGIKPCFNNDTQHVNWHLKQPSFGEADSNALYTVTFLVYPILGKIVPCTFISIFGGLLLHTLSETDKRARRLKGDSTKNGGNNGHNSQTRRTTSMLLLIMTLYIISELPQAILVLLCIFVKDFFIEVYSHLSDIIDLLTLINSAINFITYCTMSTQFRKTLIEITCANVDKASCACCTKCSPSPANALQSTKYSKTPPAPV